MLIKNEEIRGFFTEEGAVLCEECFKGELSYLTAGEILTDKQVEDSEGLYFCDECGKQL